MEQSEKGGEALNGFNRFVIFKSEAKLNNFAQRTTLSPIAIEAVFVS